MKKTPASNRGTKNGSKRSTPMGSAAAVSPATEPSSRSTAAQPPRRPKP